MAHIFLCTNKPAKCISDNVCSVLFPLALALVPGIEWNDLFLSDHAPPLLIC